MKLLVKVTRIVTTDDLNITCDPPLTFEVSGNLTPPFFEAIKRWEMDGSKLEGAIEIIGQVFVSVSQNGESYALGGQAALALYESIEGNNPGMGEHFMIRLLENFVRNHLLFFQKRRSALAPSAPPSENGSPPAS